MTLHGLQKKITLPILITTSVILLIYGFFTYNKREKNLYDDFNSAIESARERIKANLPDPIYKEDIEAIEPIIKTEVKQKEIFSVAVLDEDRKEILFSISKGPKGNFITSKDISKLEKNKERIVDPIFWYDKFTREKEIVAWSILYVDKRHIKNQLRYEIYSIIFTIFLLDISIVLIISLIANRFIIHPLQDITEVTKKISKSDFSKRVSKKYILRSQDEITLLSSYINSMTDTMESLTTNLKNEVDAQTKEIKLQNESFTNLLSNLDQGFIIMDFKGEVLNDPTEKTLEILGVNPKHRNVTELFKFNNTEKVNFLKWLGHVKKGLIPFKDLLGLSILRLEKFRGLVVKLDYRPIYSGKGNKRVEKVICILNDITKEINAQKKILFAQEKSDMVLRLIDYPVEFLDVFTDLQSVIDGFKKHSFKNKYEELFRNFHTLKARFSNFKISLIVKRIHDIESDLFLIMNKINKGAEKDLREGKKETLVATENYKDREAENVYDNLKFKIYNLESFLKFYLKENRKVIELAQSSLASGSSQNELQAAKKELLKFYDSINLKFIRKNIKDAFSIFYPLVKQLSDSQDKLIRLEIEETDITINLQPYKEFFQALQHVFRNAVDHGIEEKNKRIDQNKNEEAYIKVIFKRKGLYRFQIVIRDDGKGIDSQKIRNKVRKNYKEMNLPEDELDNLVENLSSDQLLQMIFEPGFTTKEDITALSGRGVGMDAVKKAAEEIEGKVWVESQLGEGTVFIAELPLLMV